MANFVVMLLLLAMAGQSSATWCICRDGMSDSALQKTLDYACGAGADCNPTHSTGPCFQPNTVRGHCNYAVNSYFQRNRQQTTACDFSGTAYVVPTDPSSGTCSFPSSATGGTTTVGGSPTTINPNGGSTPLGGTPGVLGGVNNGLGPTGINNDISGGIILGVNSFIIFFSYTIATLSGLIFCWA